MKVKRFVAASARECLRRVKEELGPDAIVVSNKPIPGGVEIMAMSAASLDALSQPAAPAPTAPPVDEEDDYAVSLSSKARSPFRPWQPPMAAPAEPAPAASPRPQVRHELPVMNGRSAPPPASERPRLRPLPREGAPSPQQVAETLAQVAEAASRGSSDAETLARVDTLMNEMRSIKAILERQLAGFAWSELQRQTPARAMLLGEMLEAGFSGLLSRRLVDEMPESASLEEGRKWLKNAVNRRLRTLSPDNDIIDQGGVFALVGPTGVGKTTTTAKLAARCVVRYGAERLALMTTDGYRIGAHEQLRIYGRILGVQVHVVRDAEDLRRTLADLRDKHMILIDTVGMSQRDRMVAEQASMLARGGQVGRLLLLSATSRGDTLDDVVRAYGGDDLAGCILTKVDEAASLAPALDCVLRHGLLLAYVANGQRVPEDLHLPNRAYLLHRAFRQPGEGSPHHLESGEIGLLMKGAGATRPTPARSRLNEAEVSSFDTAASHV